MLRALFDGRGSVGARRCTFGSRRRVRRRLGHIEGSLPSFRRRSPRVVGDRRRRGWTGRGLSRRRLTVGETMWGRDLAFAATVHVEDGPGGHGGSEAGLGLAGKEVFRSGAGGSASLSRAVAEVYGRLHVR